MNLHGQLSTPGFYPPPQNLKAAEEEDLHPKPGRDSSCPGKLFLSSYYPHVHATHMQAGNGATLLGPTPQKGEQLQGELVVRHGRPEGLEREVHSSHQMVVLRSGDGLKSILVDP